MLLLGFVLTLSGGIAIGVGLRHIMKGAQLVFRVDPLAALRSLARVYKKDDPVRP